jgi:peptidoglycan/LPS O-acetylase OafA/YrhL
LSIEETFYLFFPLVCFPFGRGKLLVVFLLTFVALGPFGRTEFAHGNEVWREYSYLGGMDAIALGCLTAIFLNNRILSRAILHRIGALGAVLVLFILGFSIRACQWGLVATGLDMTVIAVGTCLVIIAAAQTKWRGPRPIVPFLLLGQRSYEIYLTHMFVVVGCLHLFLLAGRRMWTVPLFFIGVILVSAVFGELVARYYSEPMNRWLRKRWSHPSERLGSMVGPTAGALPDESHISS